MRWASERRRQVRALLEYLSFTPGQTWQQRWDGCEYADGSLPRFGLPNDERADARIALKLLISEPFRATL